MSFSDLPLEVRNKIYLHLEPDYEEEEFDIKQILTDDDDDGNNEHEDANLLRISHEMRACFRFPYLRRFQAIISRGNSEDIIDFDVYNTSALGYFLRSGITHFGRYICDYETGYDDGSKAGEFASGKIEVWVEEDGEIGVSGSAECDDQSWDCSNWEWFREFRGQIKRSIQQDPVGLISWDLMETIDTELENEVESLRRSAVRDEEENEEGESESGTSDDDEEENESGTSDDEDEAQD